MANAIYPKWKEALIGGAPNSVLTGSGATGLYCALVDTNIYTYDAAHQFYTSLAGIAGLDQEITAVTFIDGFVDGSDLIFMSVPAGPTLEALVLYRKNAGAASTWRLVTYIDNGVINLPVTPGGGNILITWNVSGIFRL